jgi:acetamidase/formamidase
MTDDAVECEGGGDGGGTGGERDREAHAHPHGFWGAMCGGLFGCGEDSGRRYQVEPEAVRAALRPGTAGRLDRMDEIDRGALEPYLSSYQVSRRRIFGLGGVLGLLAAVSPASLRHAFRLQAAQAAAAAQGRIRVVESNRETVRLGVFDTTLPNIIELDSGDVLAFPNTWTHFLNGMQPGVPVEQLARWRIENPGKGPHSIIGPVGVRGARRGDVLEIRFLRLTPLAWGANFNNPGALKTGALPDEFPEGQVKYMPLDRARKVARFSPQITLPLGPFQGTLGVAPAPDREVVGQLSPGVYSSVPPAQHGGNLDLREQIEGTTLYLPVWRDGAKIYTGDSHAMQGDGEVNLTALETAMQDVRIQVILHEQPQPAWEWPLAETPTHWIALGTHRDLGQAFRIALHNTIDFLVRKARLSRLDAYGLASLAASFRITQVVDVNQGVHAMIPKNIFAKDLRDSIRVV